MRSFSTKAHSHRTGSTLIDVAAGSAILSLLLIPALSLMGQSSRVARRLAVEEALLFDADRILEAHKVSLCDVATFDGADVRLNQATANASVANGRFMLESNMDTSLPAGQLRTITVTTWQDANQNLQLDAPEPQQVLRTQWCRP